MSLFGHALALTLVQNLRLLLCVISDSELDVLGEILKANTCLKSLTFDTYGSTPAGFCKFLCHFKTSTRSHLHELLVNSNIAEHTEVQQVVREINHFRSTLPYQRANLIIQSEDLRRQSLNNSMAMRFSS